MADLRIALYMLTAALCLSLTACRGGGEFGFSEPSGVATLGIISGLKGTVEPCGCTSKPLGGLPRIAFELETLRREKGAQLLVVGDTFYELESPPAERVDSEIAKAQVIRDALATMPTLGLVTGAKDDAGPQWSSLLSNHDLPHFRTQDQSGLGFDVQIRIETIEGVRVGVIGLSGQVTPRTYEHYTQAALHAKDSGAEIVVAMFPVHGMSIRDHLKNVSGVDIAVGGGTDAEESPLMVGDTLVVHARDKGRELGILEIHRKTEGPFVFDDQGAEQKRSLNARITSLRRRVDAMDDGPARDARAKKLMTLETRLDSLVVAEPEGNFFRWNVLPVTKKGSSDSRIATLVKDYNLSLCDIAATSMPASCPPAPSGEAYAGNAVCKACHAEAFNVYAHTSHAKAWSTLEVAGKQCDVGCIKCHSVGFQEPGGPCSLKTLDGFKDVGCENCHGPGQSHIADPMNRESWSPKFIAAPTEATCLTCHTPEHSDLFDYAVYLPKVLGPGHGQKRSPAAALELKTVEP